jgi:hypothetical protein
MSTSGNFFNEPESISRQTSTRSEAVSETGTLKRFFNEQQSLSEEEEGSEEETESNETESKSDDQVDKSDNQVEEELTKGLEGLHLGEETESEEETESDETKTDNEMSANQGTGQAPGSQALVQTNRQMGKSLVPDPGFFDGEQKKFSDWWRGMKLFLKFNKVKTPDMKIAATISQMRGGTAGNFATHWTDKVANMDDTMDWKAFDDDFTGSFSMGNEKEITQWKIESFKQGNRHIADFLIEFHVLKTTSKTDDAHAIFLLKKNIRQDIIKTILGYPPAAIPDTMTEWLESIKSVGMEYEANEMRKDIRTESGITYGGSGLPMEIGKRKFLWNDKGEPKCYKCELYGHMGKNCPNKKSSNVKCYRCGKFGHMSKSCWSKGPKVRMMNEETGNLKLIEEEAKLNQGFSEGSE